jgi:type II secretory pathway component PulF
MFYHFLRTYCGYQQFGFNFLQTLYEIQKKGKFSWIDDLCQQLHLGYPLPLGLEHCKQYFSPLDYAYLCICLQTNTFDDFAPKYLKNIQKNLRLKNKIIQKAIYPLLMFALGILVSILLYCFLRPAYVDLSKNLGIIAVDKDQWPILPTLFVGFGLLLSLAFQFPKLKNHFFPVTLEIEIIRWSQMIELGLGVNLALIDCLTLIETHLQLQHLGDFNQAWIYHLRQGNSFQESLIKAPKILKQAFQDYQGNQDFFKNLSLTYQIKLNKRLQMIERYLQPSLLLMVAIICFSLFYQLYQPLFQLSLI